MCPVPTDTLSIRFEDLLTPLVEYGEAHAPDHIAIYQQYVITAIAVRSERIRDIDLVGPGYGRYRC